MKKIVKLFINCILIINLLGCNSNLDIGEESNIEVINHPVLKIKENTLKNYKATLILENNTNNNLYYGEPYEIEINKNGKWHKINIELCFILPLYHLEQNESVEIELNWKNSYGKLNKGHYRIIKNITINEETKYISVEFKI